MDRTTVFFPFSFERKYKIIGIGVLFVFIIFWSFNTMFRMTVWPKWTDFPIIYACVAILTILYSATIIFNINFLLPRLLLRNKYFYYLCSLFGLAFIIVLTKVLTEQVIHYLYQLPLENLKNLENNISFILYVFAYSVNEFFFLFATSLFFFLQHWSKTGDRIHELEETKVRVELEKARTKIDSSALFDVLNQAASIVISAPDEASRILMELSKSLRQQLYESDRKHSLSTLNEKTKLTLGENNFLLDFLIEERYRWARNALFIFIMISCTFAALAPKVEPHFYLLLFALLTIMNCIHLSIIYLNIYSLIPRLLYKNKIKTYFFVLCFLVFVYGFILQLITYIKDEPPVDFVLICNFISDWSKTVFFIALTTTIVIFQHWGRNERYIAKLEAATMNAELEQLQNQINPHFLFNMLNNILALIHENSKQAAIILREMSDMLKYQFDVSVKKVVLLSDDIKFLTDYLNLEKIRRDHFEFSIATDNNVEHKNVPPLLFIPFVENAVKYSADAVNMSYLRLYFGATDEKLIFSCHNSKSLKPYKKNEYSGLGLFNIRRRLDLLYRDNYSLNIQEEEKSYKIQLEIKY